MALDPQHPAAVSLPAPPAGLGGVIRHRDEDFVVEEIPLCRPSGHGEHVVFQVEKRGHSTFEALLWLSKALQVSEHGIGYAGLKDAHAVAIQSMSVARRAPERVLRIRHPRLRILSAARHGRHLKIGHHRGNRFTIRIRGVDPARIPAARAALETLARRGMPNAYGEQRFGIRQDGHLVGRMLVDEDWPAFASQVLGRPSPLETSQAVLAARRAFDEGDVERAWTLLPLRHRTEKKLLAALRRGAPPREAFLAIGMRTRKIWVSALQSWVFNRVLDRRVGEGTYDRLLEGDVAWLTDSTACYVVAEEEAEAERARTLVASPTGPLVGFDLVPAGGATSRLEAEVLREEGIDPEAFRAGHVYARGHRRPLRVPVEEASLAEEDATTVVVRFVLPPGAFATVLLDQLMRRPEDPPPGAPDPGRVPVDG